MATIHPTHKVVVSDNPSAITVETRPTPKPQGAQILIRLEASGVCATDLHLIQRSIPYLQPTVSVCGHEGVGRVVQLGPDVDSTKFKVGDRVAHRWVYRWCGECESCESGNEQSCDRRVLSGKDIDGCWSGKCEFILSGLYRRNNTIREVLITSGVG
jgi:propanol-preferring alcohol dehydrogenase